MNTSVTSSPTKKFAPVEFIRSTVVELKKVDWPSRQKALQLTGIVIAVCVVFSLFVGGLDITFTRLIEKLISLRK